MTLCHAQSGAPPPCVNPNHIQQKAGREIEIDEMSGKDAAPAGKLSISDSPFLELQAPFTAYEAFKMVLLLPVAIPRAIIGVLAIALVALINSIAAWNWPVNKPLTPRRRAAILWSKELLIIVFWCVA